MFVQYMHSSSQLSVPPSCPLKLMAGAARSMVVASARTTAAEIAARWCARKARGEDRERPYNVYMCIPGGVVGGRRACVLTECSQRAVEGGGERACGLGNHEEGHRVCPRLPPLSFYR